MGVSTQNELKKKSTFAVHSKANLMKLKVKNTSMVTELNMKRRLAVAGGVRRRGVGWGVRETYSVSAGG